MSLQKSQTGFASIISVGIGLLLMIGLLWFYLNSTSSSTNDSDGNSTPDVIDNANEASDSVRDLNQKREDVESNLPTN